MKQIHGQEVFSSVDELLDPRHSALVLIDMQNDFCTPNGHFDLHCKDLSSIAQMIPRLIELVSKARDAGVPIFHLQQTTLPNGAADSAAWLYLKTRDGKDPDYTLAGTWGHRFVEGLEPVDGEQVVEKHRSSGFVNTRLPTLLTSRGIKTIACAGVTTQGCVESTARDSVFFDFHAVVVEDCVASTSREIHEASLLVQRVRHEVLPSEDVLNVWTSG